MRITESRFHDQDSEGFWRGLALENPSYFWKRMFVCLFFVCYQFVLSGLARTS